MTVHHATVEHKLAVSNSQKISHRMHTDKTVVARL